VGGILLSISDYSHGMLEGLHSIQMVMLSIGDRGEVLRCALDPKASMVEYYSARLFGLQSFAGDKIEASSIGTRLANVPVWHKYSCITSILFPILVSVTRLALLFKGILMQTVYLYCRLVELPRSLSRKSRSRCLILQQSKCSS
jgi:hypothetical protein